MTKEQIEKYMSEAKQKRAEARRASIVRGNCVKCGWKASPGMTAALEYDAHLAEHQLENLLEQIEHTWGQA